MAGDEAVAFFGVAPRHRPRFGSAPAVIQVLDQQVNPTIAAHGGRAELVGVEQGTAYLRLGGGCQGCAMSALTLREGIQSAILASIPEITAVEDTTDHASGENPFY